MRHSVAVEGGGARIYGYDAPVNYNRRAVRHECIFTRERVSEPRMNAVLIMLMLGQRFVRARLLLCVWWCLGGAFVMPVRCDQSAALRGLACASKAITQFYSHIILYNLCACK